MTRAQRWLLVMQLVTGVVWVALAAVLVSTADDERSLRFGWLFLGFGVVLLAMRLTFVAWLTYERRRSR